MIKGRGNRRHKLDNHSANHRDTAKGSVGDAGQTGAEALSQLLNKSSRPAIGEIYGQASKWRCTVSEYEYGLCAAQ